MAVKSNTVGARIQAAQIIEQVKEGRYSPVYLLMGDEPYYPDLVCRTILDKCIDPSLKDFNETVRYGADVTAEQIVTAAREFPMMAERRLVVVKDAQLCKDIESVSVYLESPLESTVLVLLMRGSAADKRRSLYKLCQKQGTVMESAPLRDYEVPSWIQQHFQDRGLHISPDAAALFAEYAGVELSRIVAETEKLLKNLPQGETAVNVSDIERNIGISRDYSVFELTKELSFRNAPRALLIAGRLGGAAKFKMPAAVSALYTHFNRILRYSALLAKTPCPTQEQKSSALAGVNPYFYREYDAAVRNYPLAKSLEAISLLCEYDYLGKGGDGGSAGPDELFVELISKLLIL